MKRPDKSFWVALCALSMMYASFGVVVLISVFDGSSLMTARYVLTIAMFVLLAFAGKGILSLKQIQHTLPAPFIIPLPVHM